VDTTVVNATGIAKDLGSVRSMNLVLFGALVSMMGLTGIDWETVIRENVKKETIIVNLKAFQAGLDQVG
jgi:indolepyruvate ferredoxin oxidoreductase beta subunit